MNKSWRTAVGASPSRRLSQPQPTVSGSASSLDKSRRSSEVVSMPRTSDSLPQGTSDLAPQSEEKFLADKRSRKLKSAKETPEIPSFDPDHYNPDGSLRTVHRMPSFNEAYAEAGKARYIRHPVLLDSEKELSVKQIFDHS